MLHTFDAQVRRSTRGDTRRGQAPWVAFFEWKADGVLIESGEYTVPELERLLRELRPTDPNFAKFTTALSDLRKAAGR